jgi:hypothetical protein
LAAGAFLFVLLKAFPIDAQILYVRPVGTGAQQVGQLRQINADGTGDAAVAVPFADVLGPVTARDGTQFAVYPVRPNQLSRNVFTVNRATLATQNATNFVDFLGLVAAERRSHRGAGKWDVPFTVAAE